MSCALTTTPRIRRAVASPTNATGSTSPTRILDWHSPALQALTASLDDTCGLALLHAAHTAIAARIRPVYSLDEQQPASRTLAKGRGSCSQRFAVLEAVARSRGIATRSRVLLVDGSFWRARFGALAPLLPNSILLAWPQFRIDGRWVDASDLFILAADARPFENAGDDTLFDAVGRGAAPWSQDSDCGCTIAPDADDLGTFESRDAVFAHYGQNLPAAIRIAIEPVFGRWAAGASPDSSRESAPAARSA